MRLQPVLRGHLRLVGAGAIGELLAIPEGGAVRGQDRPAHSGEAAHEEVADGLHDVMVGLEPSDEHGFAVRRLDLAEAHKGVHLVNVAVDRLSHRAGAVDIRVAGVLEQARRGAQPPQQTIEQGEALGVGVEDHLPGQRDEALGHAELRPRDGGHLRDLVAAEEVAVLAATRQTICAGGISPAPRSAPPCASL